MSFLSKLFGGGPDVIKSASDAIIKAGDALVFTDEEKSVADQKKLDWYLDYIKATNPQNVSRRAISIIITLLWALLILVGVAAQGFGQSDFAKYVFDTLGKNVGGPFLVIIGFYFAAHAIRANK